MKALLMYPDRDFDLEQALPPHEQALTQDLELDIVLRAMAGDNPFLLRVARQALLSAMQNEGETILYRQEIVRDALAQPDVVRTLYAHAVEALERRRKSYLGIFARYPGSILASALEVLQLFVDALQRVKSLVDVHAAAFESRGFRALFAMLQQEFDADYFAALENHLSELRLKRGVLLSAELGPGNAGTHYVLRHRQGDRPNWLERLLGKGPRSHTFRLHERDEAGARILSELRDRGVNLVANALAQSMDHIQGFFEMLCAELAFYVGCINLHERIAAIGASTCFPRPDPAGTRMQRFDGLYDLSLALTMGRRIVGNTVDADGSSVVIVTGANQGGKSSFLRSIGLAQLMMQSGLFVAADSFTAEVCSGLFTHYKREEDATMKSGKLDEELARMSEIADLVTPDSLLLFNESFASTNEREGAEIASQVVRALLERRIKVFFVTHQYEFARGFVARKAQDALFLRAERRPDGTRPFRLVGAEPLDTSYGEDLYREVFADSTEERIA